jgi:hypothetical protein
MRLQIVIVSRSLALSILILTVFGSETYLNRRFPCSINFIRASSSLNYELCYAIITSNSATRSARITFPFSFSARSHLKPACFRHRIDYVMLLKILCLSYPSFLSNLVSYYLITQIFHKCVVSCPSSLVLLIWLFPRKE